MAGLKRGIAGSVVGLVIALLVGGPSAGQAYAAVAAPAGDVISIGDPDAIDTVDLYVDPLCPFSGKMIREQGAEIGRRLEDGSLHLNLRFVNFLEKYSASGSYDSRAIAAAYVVADHSRSSDVAWRFVERIYAADQQPEEGGATDLSNDQLAGLASEAGAPQPASDLIRFGIPVGYDPHAIAANNLTLLRGFPEPGVPLVVIEGQPVDGDSDWLAQLAH